MSGKYEFDKTRHAIGANQMSDDERAAMLQKFKDGGGEVLKDNLVNKQPSSSRKSRSTESDHIKNLSSRYEQKTSVDGGSRKLQEKSQRSKTKHDAEPQKGFFDLLFFRIRASLAGVTNFAGNKIKPTFAKFIIKELQPSLLLLHGNLNYFFLSEQEGIQNVTKKLDEENPIFLEILDYLHSLSNVSYFYQIDEILKNTPDGSIDIKKIIEPIEKLYLKLYYLSPWVSTIPKAVNRLYQIYIQEFPKGKDIYQSKIKEIVKTVNNILDITMKNYFFIICCDAKLVFEPASKYLQNHIGFDHANSLGNRVAGENCAIIGFSNSANESTSDDLEESSEQSDANDEDEDEEANDPITKTKEYQYGKLLMSKLVPSKMREKHDQNGYYSFCDDLDKAFLAAMYFKEFDCEYSPILVTKQIHYNIDFSYGVKKDYSKILPELVAVSRNIDQIFEEYCRIEKEMKNLQEIPRTNYIEQSKRETLLRSKIHSQTGFLKEAIISYLRKVVSNLATLITGMKEDKNIVANMEDILSFGGELDRKKKLAGQKVKEGITEVYCYSLAFKYQIEDGNLKGIGLLDDTATKRLFGVSGNNLSSTGEPTTEGAENGEGSESGEGAEKAKANIDSNVIADQNSVSISEA